MGLTWDVKDIKYKKSALKCLKVNTSALFFFIMFKPREIGKESNDALNESPVAASVIGKCVHHRRTVTSVLSPCEFVATIQQDYFTCDKLWTGLFEFRSTSDSTQHSPQNPVLSLLFPSPLCNAVKKHFPSGSSLQSTLQCINTQQWKSHSWIAAAVRMINGWS